MNMEINTIHSLNDDAVFNSDQATSLVPLLNLITRKSKQEINLINSRLSSIRKESELAISLNQEMNLVIAKWADKVRRLGGVPLSPFKVELNSEIGRYTWEYPQADLNYFNQ